MSSSLKVGAVLTSLLVLCLWYVPYYIQHSNLYEKHLFVLRTECVDGKLHPMIQHNVMTYDGVPTNCSHAQVVTSIPVLIGAANAMWEGSVFYTLLHATTWQVQLAYIVFAAAIVIWLINSWSKHRTTLSVLDAFKGTNRVLAPLVKQTQTPTPVFVKYNPAHRDVDTSKPEHEPTLDVKQMAKRFVETRPQGPSLVH